MSSRQENMVALDTWLHTPAGQYFVLKEQAWINQTVQDLFGFRAIQLGTRVVDGLLENRIPHHAYVAEDVIFQGSELHQEPCTKAMPDCVASYEELPFDSNSIDLIVMPHVLEFAQDPHQVLREVERVLMPEGRVILTGFNPMSLWGLRHSMFKRWGGVWPKGCEPIHLGRLKDWFKLLSLEPELGRFGGYRFPAHSEKGLRRMGFMEKAGDRWWPVCGGVYFLCAAKRVRGMRLVGPAFKTRQTSVGQLKPVAQQVANKTNTIED